MASALLVVGMHRSGTSALTGVLQLLGVELGRELMPARAGVNDKGFFEHERIFRTHNALLEALGSSWDDVAPLPDGWWRDARAQPFRVQLAAIVREEFGDAPLWGLKDPRLCKTLPLWSDLLAEQGIELCPVLIGRAPEEVGESLRKVHGIAPEKARALWLRHVLDGERATRGRPRVLVTYDQLLADWRAVVARIGKEFTLAWPRAAETAANEVRAFLDPQLRRSREPAERGAAPMEDAGASAGEVWRRFERAAGEGALQPATALDDAASGFEAMLRSADLLVAELRAVREEAGRRAAELTKAKALAAARDQEIARGRAELAQFRSEAGRNPGESAKLQAKVAELQATVAAARASIRRRHRVLRRARRLLAWRLLNLWRALARRMRRRARA